MLTHSLKKRLWSLQELVSRASTAAAPECGEMLLLLVLLKHLEWLDNRRPEGQPSIFDSRPEVELATEARWSKVRSVERLMGGALPWLRNLGYLAELHGLLDSPFYTASLLFVDYEWDAEWVSNESFVRLRDEVDALHDDTVTPDGDVSLLGQVADYVIVELSVAFKGGQLRTPRHILRFMAAIARPEVGELVIDPIAGTGGSLVIAHEAVRMSMIAPGDRRVTWRGSPLLSKRPPREFAPLVDSGAQYVAAHWARPVARLAWINMLLNGIERPCVDEVNSIARIPSIMENGETLMPNTYDVVISGPAFGGRLDEALIAEDLRDEIPSDAVTTNPEYLYVWRTMSLLKPGGRAVLFVPESLLHSTNRPAVALRRELLRHHDVRAVVALPQGVLAPTASTTKTAILYFHKGQGPARASATGDIVPTTQGVWFYDVTSDGYSLDAIRRPLPDAPNDLDDALINLEELIRNGRPLDAHRYYQRPFDEQVWRHVDQALIERYPKANDLAALKGTVAAVADLFPETLEAGYHERLTGEIEKFVEHYVRRTAGWVFEPLQDPEEDRKEAVMGRLAECMGVLSVQLQEQESELELESDLVWRQFEADIISAFQRLAQSLVNPTPGGGSFTSHLEEPIWSIGDLALEYLKRDGTVFRVQRRVDLFTEGTVPERKHWRVPVRAYGPDGGNSIEANSWSLALNQYHPFELESLRPTKPLEDLLDELIAMEQGVLNGLERLRVLVHGDV